jgi:LysR family transcriptional regulator, nod-box dependent transcriptional activator
MGRFRPAVYVSLPQKCQACDGEEAVNLVQFDLNLLVALDALLRERNVTRAGQRIGLSQPAMSGTLARLRDLFHDDLLVRVGRNLELTPLAQELGEPLRQCIERIEDMMDHRRSFSPARESRSFTVAASDYAAFMLLPPLLDRLGREAPGVTVKFTQLDARSQELLANDRIDFVVMPSEIETNNPGELLFMDHWVCAVWSKHPSLGDRLSAEQFCALSHVGYALPENDGRSVADLHLSHLQVRPRVAATTASFLMAPFLLRGTPLITVTHRRLAARIKDAADIKIFEPPYPMPDIHESVYWNPRHAGTPSHRWLRSVFVDIARKL